MKKKILFMAAIFGASFGSIAQEGEDKVFTPVAGDWGLGFDAAPVLNYMGNMFNGNLNNGTGTAFVDNNQAIFGKYFVDESTAYRGMIRLASMSSTMNTIVDLDTNSVGTNYDMSETNTVKYSGGAVVIGAGLEKRKGQGRLQGFYGGEVLVTLGGTTPNVTYTYETATLDSNLINKYEDAGQTGQFDTYDGFSGFASRTLSSKAGSTFGFGVRGFIGVEYFIVPKISLGGEFGWGVGISNTKGGETVTQYYGYENKANEIAGTETTYERTALTGKSSTFNLDTDNFNGSIKLMFHF